ncbi:MAG: SUMF1/EgtB/PvdO family nonheme iron enzyme [Planctomycetota bacterium]
MPSPPHDIFLSYAREDADRVAPLVAALQARGWSVWWDREVLPGEGFRKVIGDALEGARAVVVVWSNVSVQSKWVCGEANSGLGREILVPVRIDDRDPPLGFQETQTADLTAWGGAADAEELQPVLAGLDKLLGSSRPNAAPPLPAREPGELETMIQQLESLRAGGADTTDLAAEIRAKKAQLRKIPAPQPGEVIGANRYALEALLGNGGFAQVWKAFDRRRQAFVALKILHGHLMQDESRVRRFFSGARKQAKLEHPHIVRVLEPEERDEEFGWLFFAMDLVDGADLRRAVLKEARTRDELLAALTGVAEGLDYASTRHDIVHRDVKPANILLGVRGAAYLTDFDLVLAPESTQGTMLGQGMGTYDFAAPEVLRGEGGASHASDVYSLAMTALWALSGGTLRGRLESDIELALEAADLSAAGADAVRRALAQDPSLRPASSTELTSAISETATREPGREGAESPAAARAQRPVVPDGRVRRSRGSTATPPSSTGLPASWEILDRTLSDDWPKRVRDPRTGVAFVLIPSGRFTMGSPSNEPGRSSDEGPQRRVTIARPFYLAETAVTVAQWNTTTGGDVARDDELPVVGVSWEDAVRFCEQAGYRLTSEAEWEYACRAGTTTPYSFEGGEEDLLEHGWFFRNSGERLLPAETTWDVDKAWGEWGCRVRRVARMQPNDWGLYDMHGNVWEWCQDSWHRDYDGAPADSSAWEASGSESRVIRGGSFFSSAQLARSAYRFFGHPSSRNDLVGFRPARVITE